MPEVEDGMYELWREKTRDDVTTLEVRDQDAGAQDGQGANDSVVRSVGDSNPDGPTWDTVDTDNPQEMSMILSGDDADVGANLTVDELRLYETDSPSSTDWLGIGSIDAFTFETSDDQLTVICEVEIPEIPE